MFAFLSVPRFPCSAAAPIRAGILASLLGMVLSAQAAGGHHAVDDAAVLAPGECQLETWLERHRGGVRRLLHLGPACRVGAVELGLNLDSSRTRDAGSAGLGGAQLKWAQALAPGVAAGVLLSTTARRGSPHWAGSSLVLPFTWDLDPAVQLHLNLGRDFRHQAKDTSRGGAALEWTPCASWSFVGERFRETGASFHRLGARYSLNPALQLDLSRAWGLGAAPGGWAAGLNWGFAKG